MDNKEIFDIAMDNKEFFDIASYITRNMSHSSRLSQLNKKLLTRDYAVYLEV